jgi:hypothetical protein
MTSRQEDFAMIRFKSCIALVVLLAGGCAAAPELTDQGAPAREDAVATPPSPTAPAANAATGAASLVVDVNELVASTPPPIICKQMLKKNSNVIVNQCGTAEQWKAFYRRQELDAQETVRMMQGSHYR